MGDEANSSNYPNQYQSKKSKLAHEIQTHITEEISNLPEEIILEILIRLPVKSLLKFRCVSKLWLSIISSPQFIKSHLKISKNGATLDNRRILFTVSTPCILLKQCSVNSVLYEPSAGVFDVDYPKRRLDRSVGVVGTCNGLVCIAINEKKLFLWNPATRASTRLPFLNVELNLGFYYLSGFGFGYDECGDDYKVISIFVDYVNGTQCKSLVKMYSLKNNSWKTIDNFQGRIRYFEAGKFASGKLHFSTKLGSVHVERWDITSIDLSTEVYGIVEQPNYGEGHFDFTWDVLGGCICVISHYGTMYADLWVLKEYGVKESWTKMVTMSYINDSRGSLLSGPLLMMPGGKILMALGHHLVVYNPKDSNVRYLELSNLKRGFLEVNFYAESLVSPAVG